MQYPMTLMDREDTEHRVEMVYHGPEARQKLTIHVHWLSGEFEDFSFAVQDEYVVDAFNHPHWYRDSALAA